MIITKYTKQKMEVIKKTLPDLYTTLRLHFPEAMLENSPILGEVAGLIIEYVLKSGGTDEIFQDAELNSYTTEEDYLDLER